MASIVEELSLLRKRADGTLWRAINAAMQKESGLKSKTWLSGINTNTIGGFYEFDSLKNAKAYAEGYLAAAAKRIG